MKKPTLLFLFFIALKSISAQNIHLWNGETNDDLLCSLNNYFEYNNSEAFSTPSCLEGRFDIWNRATISLSDCSYYRKNIAFTQSLCFQIKANKTDQTVFASMSAWHFSNNSISPEINIAPFLLNGNLTADYQQVCIPLEEFRDGKFTALWLESLSFKAENPEPDLRVFIDDIFLKDTLPAMPVQIENISNQAIRVHFNGRYDKQSAENISNYILTSSDDANYLNPVNPFSVGLHYYYDGLQNDTIWLALPKSYFTLFLIFDEPLKNGFNYNLEINNISDPAGNQSGGNNFPYLYSDKKINGSVKVNQIGYLPDSPKYAYVGNYIGSAGMLEINPTVFEIRDALSDQVVFSENINFRGDDPLLSGEKIYDCDFSNFTQTGNYYIYVPGIGRSYDFEINPAVYNEAFQVATKGLFLSRCGMELESAHAGVYARPTCHQNDVLVHASIQNTATYGNETVGSPLEVIGGWHDAGDYSRPLSNQIVVISDLLNALEFFPEKMLDDWNIPESNNHIADILDEAKWGLDFLLKMQSDDGGVYFKVATTGYPPVLPHEDERAVLCVGKNNAYNGHVCGGHGSGFPAFQKLFARLCGHLFGKSGKGMAISPKSSCGNPFLWVHR